jgi:hypothetical protein
MFDALIYATMTAGTCGWLWPFWPLTLIGGLARPAGDH